MNELSAQRITMLGEQLSKNGLDAYFAWSPVTMGYLSGFHEGAGERFLVFAYSPNGQQRLICPALSVNQATRSGVKDVRGLKDGESPTPEINALVTDFGLTGKVAVDDDMPSALLITLQNQMPGIEFVAGWPYFGEVARKKSQEELTHLFTAGDIADKAFHAAKPQIKAGMTELEVARLLQDGMEERGGQPMFAIVASGVNGAEPHHMTDETVLKEGDVLIMDFGCRVHGYHSDITRTLMIGEPSEKQKEVYQVVNDAHHAARRVLRAGVTAGEVDQAARSVIEKAGYGEYFTHRTGHGLGLKIHEEPYIMPGSDLELKPGDVFSIEPGIYLPGEFGVRLENIVTLTEDGHESFNEDPASELESV